MNSSRLAMLQIMKDNNFSIAFESDEPKIKLAVKNTENLKKLEVQAILVEKMCSIAFDLGLLNKGSGCHICIYLEKFNQSYLHLNAAHYFLLHPDPFDFLNKFRLNQKYDIKT